MTQVIYSSVSRLKQRNTNVTTNKPVSCLRLQTFSSQGRWRLSCCRLFNRKSFFYRDLHKSFSFTLLSIIIIILSVSP